MSKLFLRIHTLPWYPEWKKAQQKWKISRWEAPSKSTWAHQIHSTGAKSAGEWQQSNQKFTFCDSEFTPSLESPPHDTMSQEAHHLPLERSFLFHKLKCHKGSLQLRTAVVFWEQPDLGWYFNSIRFLKFSSKNDDSCALELRSLRRLKLKLLRPVIFLNNTGLN